MQEKRLPRLFISYRREGGFQTARWLHDQLEDRGYDVFLDMVCLGGGAFNENLMGEIAQRDVLLVVLTKDSLKRRYFREDWMRDELACAFRNGLKVIPLWEKDFKFPKNLPADIAHLPMQNGMDINMVLAEPWLDMLEKQYILSKPQKPIKYPPLPTVCPWPRYVAAALAAVVLAGCLFFGISSCVSGQPTQPTTEPTTEPTTAPTTAPTTEPTTVPTTEPTTVPTEPPISEIQELGNSTGNLCNDGVCNVDNWYLTNNNVHFENAVGDFLYHYRDSSQEIVIRNVEAAEYVSLKKIPNLGYLLVTTDWFYYTTEEENAATLYRARRWAADQMGEPEVMASRFSANNDILIDGTAAYYWRTEKGLFRLDLTDGTETRILEWENIWSVDCFGISGEWVYLNTDTQIQRVHITTGEVQTVVDITEHFEDTKIVTGNVDNAWVYFAVTDLGKSGFTHNDRVYRIHPHGTAMERVYVAEGGDCRISYIGLQLGQKSDEPLTDFTARDLVIAFGCADGRNSVYVGNGHYSGYKHTHDGGFTQTLGVHVGSSQTNLCNGGFVVDTSTRFYSITNKGRLYHNCFDDNYGSVTYYYDEGYASIIVEWFEDRKTQTANLLENVICRYLFVTPDWLYCVLEEDGVNTLYRAENDPEDYAIGELEKVVSGFMMEDNHIYIRDGYVYYWVRNEGLYRAGTDGSGVERVYDAGDRSAYGWQTCYVDEDFLYFWMVKGGFYRVNLNSGSCNNLCSFEEDPGSINGVVEKDGTFYFVVQYLTDGERTRPDEIWSINPDGSEKTLVYAMPDVFMKVQRINWAEPPLMLMVEQEGQTSLYRLMPETGELTNIETFE